MKSQLIFPTKYQQKKSGILSKPSMAIGTGTPKYGPSKGIIMMNY